MTDVSNNGMFEPAEAGGVQDAEGGTVTETGPENPPADVAPDRDTDGSLVGAADVDADARQSGADEY
jgi:hypothetical protein